MVLPMIRASFSTLFAVVPLVSAKSMPLRAAGSEIVLNLEPTKENPRNSEGCFAWLNSGRFAFPKGRRTPLVAPISSDGAQTWPEAKLIEGDAEGWYCYTAMAFVDDAVLLAYCAGDRNVGNLNRLRIRRLELSSLVPQ